MLGRTGRSGNGGDLLIFRADQGLGQAEATESDGDEAYASVQCFPKS